ncbi:MAG TPA: carbohydrate porin [Thermoanaerobaculia bacterium]
MRRKATFKAGLLALVLALSAASAAMAQVTGLYYQEVAKPDENRIYVFNTPERYHSWEQSGDMGTAVTILGAGPDGETIVAENETAMDLYLFKHNLPAYERPTPKPATPAAFPATKFGIRVYADVSSRSNKDEATGVESNDSGVGVDVKRTYFTFTQQFDAKWSALFQSDIGDQGARRYDVFVKKAFVEYKQSPMATFRLGSADTPWVPYVEGVYGLRYLETVITDHLSFGTSAEWGFHVLGANPLWGYQFTIGNGRGYSNPTRSKSVDFEGRVSFTPVKGLSLAVGGYSGKRGQDTDAAPAKHTATRQDALVAYNTDKFKVGGEWFQAKNWNNVTTATDKADGWSVWGQFTINPLWAVFGRYDQADPSKDLKPALQWTYYNAGLQWTLNKAFAASLVYKYADVEGGTQGTSNGTIGSTNPKEKGKYNEIGVFTVYNF